MRDVIGQIQGTDRHVGQRRMAGGEGRTVLLRRSYDAPIEDLWDACTNPDRLGRWFLPVTGDLRVGGRYQLQGNAGGEILHCEAPHLLRVSWVTVEHPTEADVGLVEVRLAPGPDGGTVFQLEHAAVVDPQFWARFGPGAVGVGWDGALAGLYMHLRGELPADPQAWMRSPEGREFYVQCSRAWGAAHAASGATPDEVASAMKNTAAFYTGEA